MFNDFFVSILETSKSLNGEATTVNPLQSTRIVSRGGWEDLTTDLSSLTKLFLTTVKLLSEGKCCCKKTKKKKTKKEYAFEIRSFFQSIGLWSNPFLF